MSGMAFTCSQPQKPRCLRVHSQVSGLTAWSRALPLRRLASSMFGLQACTLSLMSASQQWATWIAGTNPFTTDFPPSPSKISTRKKRQGKTITAVRWHIKSSIVCGDCAVVPFFRSCHRHGLSLHFHLHRQSRHQEFHPPTLYRDRPTLAAVNPGLVKTNICDPTTRIIRLVNFPKSLALRSYCTVW